MTRDSVLPRQGTRKRRQESWPAHSTEAHANAGQWPRLNAHEANPKVRLAVLAQSQPADYQLLAALQPPLVVPVEAQVRATPVALLVMVNVLFVSDVATIV